MSLTGWQHVKLMHFFSRQKFSVGLQSGKFVSLVVWLSIVKHIHNIPLSSNKLDSKITPFFELCLVCNTNATSSVSVKNKDACVYGTRHFMDYNSVRSFPPTPHCALGIENEYFKS